MGNHRPIRTHTEMETTEIGCQSWTNKTILLGENFSKYNQINKEDTNVNIRTYKIKNLIKPLPVKSEKKNLLF